MDKDILDRKEIGRRIFLSSVVATLMTIFIIVPFSSFSKEIIYLIEITTIISASIGTYNWFYGKKEVEK